MSFEALRYDVEDNILTITLNRPEKLNAFNYQMQNDLIKAFDEADKDDNVKAIIVTGEGRGFCAGADLSAGAETFDFDNRSDRNDKKALFQKQARLIGQIQIFEMVGFGDP